MVPALRELTLQLREGSKIVNSKQAQINVIITNCDSLRQPEGPLDVETEKGSSSALLISLTSLRLSLDNGLDNIRMFKHL